MKKLFVVLCIASILTVIGCGRDEDITHDSRRSNPQTDTSQNDSIPNNPLDTISDCYWVDLGLPSGLLWATRNVGANNPEDSGYYFAWGETQTKSVYDWITYKYTYTYADGYYHKLTKYCNNSYEGYNGFIDNLTILQAIDDAATAVIGDGARIPTKAEWEELFNNCTREWISQNRMHGCRFIGRNGNALFLPEASGRYDDGATWQIVEYVGGNYWSSSLNVDNPNEAWIFDFYYGNVTMSTAERLSGLSVRPVRSARQN